ncbi:hypothetical protein [Novosphingobium cyanobacteriorum]|uniref:Uncharacterized protein n=1 Tax=Novosphingobium cyanobacteriorum TaxID=3024215 RepID=A0ABT6CIC4_9SPHN|nr:hypothetical protein [Novosphingobium cyanobacteriorum]MDF8333673.1 hypothetical protein [Novosphingobium cyanobacteriorum]
MRALADRDNLDRFLDIAGFSGAVMTLEHGIHDQVTIDLNGDLRSDLVIHVQTVDGMPPSTADLIV